MNYSTTKQDLASTLGQRGTGGHTNNSKKELCNKKKIVENGVKSHYVLMRRARLKGRLYRRRGGKSAGRNMLHWNWHGTAQQRGFDVPHWRNDYWSTWPVGWFGSGARLGFAGDFVALIKRTIEI